MNKFTLELEQQYGTKSLKREGLHNSGFAAT